MTAQPGSTTIDRWRQIAEEFHAVRWCLEKGMLSADFEPADLPRLRKGPSSGALRGVFSFLLHIFNSENRFDLGEVQRWDAAHLQAFHRWVGGKSTGHPCHYF